MPEELHSAVIPTRNCAVVLDRCLSVLRQSAPSVEVVVVDQSSSDGTPGVATKHGAALVQADAPKYYAPPSASRNVGAQVASGSVIWHLDSDMLVTPQLTQEVRQLMADSRNGALVIPEIDLPEGFWARCKALERSCYVGTPVECARVVRRSIFERVGGYDESISSGEDLDIQARYLRVTAIRSCENAVFHVLGSYPIRKAMRKKFLYGRASTGYLARRGAASFLLSSQSRTLWNGRKRLLANPSLFLGVLILRSLELVAAILGAALGLAELNLRRVRRADEW